MEAQNTISAAPVGRLLDLHFRILQAHQPSREILQDDPAHSIRDLEPLLDPVQRQHQCLQHVLSSVTHVPPSQVVPITVEDGVPTIWILHLFSGRRRRGDCHFWCEGCHGILPGYNVHILSVDTAIGAELGNLDRGPIFDRMRNITSGSDGLQQDSPVLRARPLMPKVNATQGRCIPRNLMPLVPLGNHLGIHHF